MNVFVATSMLLQRVSAETSCHVHELQDQIAPDQLAPAEKLTGVGNVQITATPEAQVT